MTYYKVKTARDLLPTYADYIKLQIADSYVAAPFPSSKTAAKATKAKIVPANTFLQYCVMKLLYEKQLPGSEVLEEIWIRTNKQWKPTLTAIYRVLTFLRKKGYVNRSKHALTEEGKNFLKEPFSDNLRFIYNNFLRINREKIVLDCACGGGSDIGAIKEMGFKYVVGAEISAKFIKTAQNPADGVLKCDMHSLGFRDESFDIIFSAHTIEHAYWPAKLLHEFFRILKLDGQLFVIIPYPDSGHEDDFHCAKYELGTNILDQGKTVVKFFEENGFRLNIKENSRGMVQEPVLWLQFRKRLFKRGKPYRLDI